MPQTKHNFKSNATKLKNGYARLIGFTSEMLQFFTPPTEKQALDICVYLITLISSEPF